MPSRLEAFLQSGDLGKFLTDSHINVDDAGLLAGLVDHGVDSDGGFAGLTVADDQFTLATADWHNGIDGG